MIETASWTGAETGWTRITEEMAGHCIGRYNRGLYDADFIYK
jgi:hypothetical protein